MDANWVAVVMSVIALALSMSVTRTEHRAAQIAAIRELVTEDYAHRALLHGEEVEINGERTSNLRSAKAAALQHRLQLERELSSEEASVEWTHLSGIKAQGSPWNRVSFNLAELLTLTGMNCFTGAASLSVTLMHVGDSIVDDWLVCRDWVASYRTQQDMWANAPFSGVPFHRREGEWIALVAALYLHRNWGERYAALVIREYGDVRGVRRRVIALTYPDTGSLSRSTCRDVSRSVSRSLGAVLSFMRWPGGRWLIGLALTRPGR